MSGAMHIDPLGTDWYYCTKCKKSFVVERSDSDLPLLKKNMRCPNYRECAGRINHRSWGGLTSGHLTNVRRITALELYQATAGVGLPEERQCSPAEMRKLMTGHRITSVHLEEAPDPKKSLLISFALDNGKVVFLSTSTHGAIIYKVEDLHGR